MIHLISGICLMFSLHSSTYLKTISKWWSFSTWLLEAWSGTSIIWELVRNKEPQGPLQTHRFRMSDENAQQSLRSTASVNTFYAHIHGHQALCAWSLSRVSATPWTVAHQAPLSMGLSREEYWSRLSCPLPGKSSRPRDRTHFFYVSCISRWVLYH